MKLIVGLGNPGSRYRRHRHNVGFMFLDWLAKHDTRYPPESPRLSSGGRGTLHDTREDTTFKYKEKLEAEIAEVNMKVERLILTKPQTFMNKSGEVVKKIRDFYKISTDEIFVMHDDLDIHLGEYKMQKGKGPRLHNGVVSIERELGTTDFWRVRIGVDNREPENRMLGETYVLQNFKVDETIIFDQLFPSIFDSLLSHSYF